MDGNVNMFGGSPLNRLSWLRPSHTFLNAIVSRPTAKWLLFNGGQPLVVQDPSKAPKKALAFLQTRELKPLLGPEPYFGQGKERGEIVPDPVATSSHSPLGGVRHHGPPVVFLGILENDGANLPLIEDILKEPAVTVSQIKGTAFFSMEISDLDLPSEELDQILRNTEPAREGMKLSWAEPRGLHLGLDIETAAIFAMAKSMVDWNSRRKFCTACGSRTYSMWGGWKLSCTSLLPWVNNVGRKPCPTAQGLHNFTHPRTDAVVIMIAIDETGDKILLGRGFTGRFYSALAGFIEPAETFEDAVKREMWEEAGVRVWDVRYHSTQPWPYPANLMVGFYARADSNQPIRTDLDKELVDAKWFTRKEVLDILGGKTGGLLLQTDYKKLADKLDEKSSTATSQTLAPAENPAPAEPITNNIEQAEDPIKLPPTTAIAGVLIKDWAEGNINFFGRGLDSYYDDCTP
ncbi:NAD+ diphosphatase [Amanita muscaria]